MLRKAIKRTYSATEKSDKHRSNAGADSTSKSVLGGVNERDDNERVLEKLVVGGEEDILDSLLAKDTKTKKKKKLKESEKPKAVWEDEDDDLVRIRITETGGLQNKKTIKKVSGKDYKQQLKNQFEKVSGTASWAKLSWEKDEHSDDSDESGNEDLLQKTGSYLATSDSLPRGALQMKQCVDANKEQPSHGKLKTVEFHPTSQVVMTAGMDQSLCLFQVDGKHNSKIQSVFLDGFPIHTAHFTRDGREVVIGSRHKNFHYYDMIAGKIVNVPKIKGLEERNMGRFEMSPDGRFIAFLGKDGHIHLISTQSKEWISSLKMNGSVDAVAFNPSGDTMYSTGDDGEVYIWDMKTRDCIHRFHDDGCIQGTALAVSKNSTYLASGSSSGVVNMYSVPTLITSRNPKPLKAIMNLTSPATQLRFNSTTELLAMASNTTERGLKMVHVPSMTVFPNFPEKTDILRIPMSMDFSMNSGYFALGNHRGQALLYRVKHYKNY